MQTTWIGQIIGARHRNPMYPIAIWNSHQLTVEYLPRTNNNVEAWHRTFQESIGLNHPQVYKLISAMINEQSFTQDKKDRIDRGERLLLYSRIEYEHHNQQLQNIIENYDNYALL
jgi:hypothetical protein